MAKFEELPEVIDYKWPDGAFTDVVANFYGWRRVSVDQAAIDQDAKYDSINFADGSTFEDRLLDAPEGGDS